MTNRIGGVLVGIGVAVLAGCGATERVAVPAPAPAPRAAQATPPAAPAPSAATEATVFQPSVGQAGKDVVWVPTSEALVQRMLDLAKLTPQDYVIDLGSGDGRNIIAAAKRGARGHGVEFNPEMVTLSNRLAREAGVADRATFIQGDMYEADISRATVMALFLLPHNLERLKDKMLALPPGTRIVMNTFTLPGWEADVTERLETDCQSWCTALLHIVPARVAGRWRIDGGGELTLAQEFQMITGTLATGAQPSTPVSGKLSAANISMTIDGAAYTGRVDGTRMSGTVAAGGSSRPWSAARVN